MRNVGEERVRRRRGDARHLKTNLSSPLEAQGLTETGVWTSKCLSIENLQVVTYRKTQLLR